MVSRGNKSERRWWKQRAEAPKSNLEIPDGLGIGVKEERDASGQLFIFLQLQPARDIVLGKYASEQREHPYYVADYTYTGPWMTSDRKQGLVTHKFEHLLMALAKVHEIVEDFERRNPT